MAFCVCLHHTTQCFQLSFKLTPPTALHRESAWPTQACYEPIFSFFLDILNYLKIWLCLLSAIWVKKSRKRWGRSLFFLSLPKHTEKQPEKFAQPSRLCGLPWWVSGKESASQCRAHGFDSWSRKIPHAKRWLNPCTIAIEPVRPRARAVQQEKPPH